MGSVLSVGLEKSGTGPIIIMALTLTSAKTLGVFTGSMNSLILRSCPVLHISWPCSPGSRKLPSCLIHVSVLMADLSESNPVIIISHSESQWTLLCLLSVRPLITWSFIGKLEAYALTKKIIKKDISWTIQNDILRGTTRNVKFPFLERDQESGIFTADNMPTAFTQWSILGPKIVGYPQGFLLDINRTGFPSDFHGNELKFSVVFPWVFLKRKIFISGGGCSMVHYLQISKHMRVHVPPS